MEIDCQMNNDSNEDIYSLGSNQSDVGDIQEDIHTKSDDVRGCTDAVPDIEEESTTEKSTEDGVGGGSECGSRHGSECGSRCESECGNRRESECGSRIADDTMSGHADPTARAQTAEVNNEVTERTEVEGVPASSRADEEECVGNSKNPNLCVARDKWVPMMAATLKERGKGKVWGEIIDVWVLLQRSWEGNEVRHYQDDQDNDVLMFSPRLDPSQRRVGCQITSQGGHEMGKVVRRCCLVAENQRHR